MNSKWITPIITVIILALWTYMATAQEDESKDQLFSVSHDVVKPSKVGEYEASIKEFHEMIQTHSSSEGSFTCSMREDYHYFFLFPIQSIGEQVFVGKAMGEWIQKTGQEKFNSFWDNFDDIIDYKQPFYTLRSADLSYTPANPRLKPNERSFLHFTDYYLRFDKNAEAQQIAREYVSLFKDKKIADGYHVYLGDVGSELPLITMVKWAKDAEDFHKQAMQANELLGEEGKKLSARLMAITRRIEEYDGWSRPDLSYPPPTKKN